MDLVESKVPRDDKSKENVSKVRIISVSSYIMGALVYHVWKARNKKLFQGVNVQIGVLVIIMQIKKEIVERIDLLKLSKRVHKSGCFFTKTIV